MDNKNEGEEPAGRTRKSKNKNEGEEPAGRTRRSKKSVEIVAPRPQDGDVPPKRDRNESKLKDLYTTLEGKTDSDPDIEKIAQLPEGPEIVEEEEDLLTKMKREMKSGKKRKFRNVLWITREIAEKLGREYVLLTTLKDTIYFAIFLLIATIITLGTTGSSTYHLFRVMEEQLFEVPDYKSVTTASDVWRYLNDVFSKSFYWDYWYYPSQTIKATSENDRNLFYENKLLGVPRIRQLRVRNDSCVIHGYFVTTFLNCYGRFSRHNEDKSTYGTGSAFKYHSERELGMTSYWGRLDWYHGGGYYEDLSVHKDETMKQIEELKKNLWITRNTRVIILDFVVYNTNLNLFAVIRAAFEFPPTGGVVPGYKIYVIKLLRYTTPYDYFILTCELVLIGFIIYYTLEEVREILYFKWHYLFKFWSYIDFGILLLGYTAMAIAFYRQLVVKNKVKEALKKTKEYPNLNLLALLQIYYNNIMAVQLFCIYLKVFKYLNFNKSMAQLNNTLSKCRKDMIGFALMFFVIFIAFAVLGYLLFGMEVDDFSSFYLAMFTLLRTILGDFDYTRIEKANRILAPVFFLCFIFLVFFVLLNMFLAIINDTYTDVKTEIAIAPEELQMSGFLKRGYYNLLIRFGCSRFVKMTTLEKNEYQMTANEIKVALRRIGFSDLEIEMFFARYNIDPNSEVGDYDVQTLMNALEGKVEKTPAPKVDVKQATEDGKPLIAIDDFIKQQERLDEIENAIFQATTAMNALLSRLDRLENVRKIKAEEAALASKPPEEKPATSAEPSPALKDVPSKEQLPKVEPSKVEPSKEEPSKDLPPKVEPSKEQLTRERVSKEQPTRERQSKEQPTRERQSKEQPTRERQSKEQPTRERKSREQPTRERQSKELPPKDGPPKDGVPKDVPPRKQQTEERSSREQPSRDVPPKEQPPKDQPSREQPSREQQSRERPSKEQPPRDPTP